MSQSKRARFTFPEGFASQGGTTRTAGVSSMSRVTRKGKPKIKWTKAQRAQYEKKLLYKIARNVDLSSHYYDLESGSASITGDGAIHNLNSGTLITKGDAATQRTGDSIHMKNINIRYAFTANLGQENQTIWKVYLVQHFHPDGGSTAAVTDIFEAKDGVNFTSPIIVPRRWDTMRDFKILASATHVIAPLRIGDNAGAYLSVASGSSRDYGEMSVPLNLVAKYDPSTGNTEENSLYLVFKNSTDTSISGGAGGNVRFWSRLTFAP